MTTTMRLAGPLLKAAGLCLTLALSAVGCTNGEIGEPGASCESSREYFLTDVWGPVMARTCVSCHAPGGTAQLRGARFQLLPGAYPDFADANLASARAMANQSYNVGGENISALLAKPLGLVSHGGGTVVREGSPEHAALRGLVERLSNGGDDTACRDYGSLAAPSGVALLDWPATFRKAALDLTGRLPTPAEERMVTTEEGFDTALAALFEEPAFYARMRTAWNDLMLTDRYVTNDGCDQRALNLISGEDFPNRGTYGGEGGPNGLNCCGTDRANPLCADVRTFFLNANNAIAREPINLFEHIVRDNRPFSEILTADYTLVNPQSAHVYGVADQVTFSSYDPTELRPARIRYTRVFNAMRNDRQTVEFPHAGVLTTPAFLSRYPTTDTNRNRHRARIVQSYFLATDILKVGERPIDPTASEALVQAPALNYGPCVTCHRINDPIAGAFRGFFPTNTAWRFNPRDAWYTDMFPPGYDGEAMPATSYGSSLKWLAPRITADPRFVSSIVRFVYRTLTGRDPLAHPTDTADALYASRSAAWTEQDRVLRAISQRVIASNLNFKTAVSEMIRSPLYRATAFVGGNSPEHTGLGTARMLTPEMLDRRIRAIAGFAWVQDATRQNAWLTGDFYLPYGGINSDTIVQRARDANGIISGIAQRMANEVACRGTAYDFTRPQSERRFFRRVALNTVPESAGQAVPGSVAQIRQNIVDLHSLILGEHLDENSPEIDRTYTLFLETWREASMNGTALVDACRGTRDPTNGMALPMGVQIGDDRNGTVRAWMAVLTYLFSDYRFLYQ